MNDRKKLRADVENRKAELVANFEKIKKKGDLANVTSQLAMSNLLQKSTLNLGGYTRSEQVSPSKSGAPLMPPKPKM